MAKKKADTSTDQTKNKKVVILGTANTMKDAPFSDMSFDIWTVSSALTHGVNGVKRCDRIFELHTRDRWENRIKLMNDRNVPVYMQEHHEDVPLSVAYPIQEILGKYRPYFTNSISFMIALAIEEGYEEIHFYGVHMITTSEYAKEMPSCEYFIGLAEGQGITCYIPPAADMLKSTKLYGYQPYAPNEERFRYRKQDLEQEMQKMQQQKAQLDQILAQYQGAIENSKFILSAFER